MEAVSFKDLRLLALKGIAEVEHLAKVEQLGDVVVMVVVQASAPAGELTRFACESNVADGSDAARVLREVAAAIEAS